MYMKRAGYLHKDVSLGNFLLHHVSGLVPPSLLDLDRAALEQWTTIITDLEFARPYLDAPVNERYIVRFDNLTE